MSTPIDAKTIEALSRTLIVLEDQLRLMQGTVQSLRDNCAAAITATVTNTTLETQQKRLGLVEYSLGTARKNLEAARSDLGWVKE